jgi:predicted DsbA family dithiol-disulfide isomerase
MHLSAKKPQEKPSFDVQVEGQIKVTYYTDPLCCWSWAFEQHWRMLLQNYGALITYEYVMGGMLSRWDNYNDPLNSVSKPIQMGPVWMHASEVTHVKMKYSIWAIDPPYSSYPPSIAFKTVALQSKEAADEYLLIIRKALMERGVNISKSENLLILAKDIQTPEFDSVIFESDWKAGKGNEPFRLDLQKTKFHGIGRFPTLTFQNTHGEGIVITGYRPYEALNDAFMHLHNKRKPSAPSKTT